MTYFLPICVGAFTKGLGFADLSRYLADPVAVRARADPDQPPASAQTGEMMQTLGNIFWLGTKELRSFFRDWVLLGLVIYSFSLAIIAQAQSNAQELHNASIRLCGRGPFRAFGPAGAGLPAALFPDRGPGGAKRHRPPDEHGSLYVHSRHSAQFRARPARRAHAGAPAQCRRHGDRCRRESARATPSRFSPTRSPNS